MTSSDRKTDGLILGTAGHIDHGKTSLVRALTGVDCDRLPEEKERGITIALGFAPLALPSGRMLSIVDVPGHEGLVRTMVAGATGIDLVLFVVAADEGIMPQSREHLAICDLLGIESGVVALTKTDAVDADLAELAQLEIAEELVGTGLEGAPIIPVSAHERTGLDELIAALDAAASAAPPRTLREGPAWLPVDRSFSMRGFGTVVTGTLRGAPLEEGQNIEILPDDAREPSRARVRGLQVHGEAAKRVLPGARCAVNLQGVELSEVPRGSVVATPGRVDYRPRVEAQLRILAGAPALADGASVTAHLGTSVRRARVALLDTPKLEPGQRGFVELRFDRPVAAVEGDRFIVRGFGRIPDAGWTVGGGRILDAAPSRARRTRAERVADLELATGDDRAAVLSARLHRAGLRGATEAELLSELRSIESLEGVRVSGNRWLHPDAFARICELVVAAVRAHHEQMPTDPWVGFAAVRARLPVAATDDAVRAALESATRDKQLVSGPSGHRDPEHQAHAADPEIAEKLERKLREAGLAPDTLNTMASELEIEVRALRSVLDHLARQDAVVRVSSDLYFERAAIDALRERVVAYLKEHGEIEPAAYKTLTGQSRKHTVPLMEYFDAQKLTARRGNLRVLRGG